MKRVFTIAGAIAATSIATQLNGDNCVDAQTKKLTMLCSVNFRQGPSTKNSVIKVLHRGYTAEYLGESNNWMKIKYDGKIGYVYGDYAEFAPNETSNEKYVSAKVGLNVRSGPSTSYYKKGALTYGTEVSEISTSNGWSKIKYNGGYGYVSSAYLQSQPIKNNNTNSTNPTIPTIPNDTSNKVESVISYAKTLLGKPYVWGAQGPNSFDCSGLMRYVFKEKAGINLPRTSAAQSKYGQYVNKKDLRAGDLVFFDTNGVNNGAVSHVGLYLGDNKILHASYSRAKIVIDNFNYSYYQNSYVNARRVL